MKAQLCDNIIEMLKKQNEEIFCFEGFRDFCIQRGLLKQLAVMELAEYNKLNLHSCIDLIAKYGTGVTGLFIELISAMKNDIFNAEQTSEIISNYDIEHIEDMLADILKVHRIKLACGVDITLFINLGNLYRLSYSRYPILNAISNYSSRFSRKLDVNSKFTPSIELEALTMMNLAYENVNLKTKLELLTKYINHIQNHKPLCGIKAIQSISAGWIVLNDDYDMDKICDYIYGITVLSYAVYRYAESDYVSELKLFASNLRKELIVTETEENRREHLVVFDTLYSMLSVQNIDNVYYVIRRLLHLSKEISDLQQNSTILVDDNNTNFILRVEHHPSTCYLCNKRHNVLINCIDRHNDRVNLCLNCFGKQVSREHNEDKLVVADRSVMQK